MYVLSCVGSWIGHFLSLWLKDSFEETHIVAILLSGLLMAWIFQRWHFYSMFPLAQQAVLKNIADGLLIADNAGYIVELNAAACELCDAEGIRRGDRFADLIRVCPELSGVELGKEWMHDSTCAVLGVPRYFSISSSPLRNATGYLLGQVLLFKNITHKSIDKRCRFASKGAESLPRVSIRFYRGSRDRWDRQPAEASKDRRPCRPTLRCVASNSPRALPLQSS